MHDNIDLLDEWRSSQKLYRAFVYLGASLSFICILTIIILKNLYSSSTQSIISKVADAIIFEVGLFCSGAFLGSALVGIIYDLYQTRFVQNGNLIAKRFLDEGIIRVFKSATDPNLSNFVLRLILKAKSEITAVGLGLGLLAHNYDILKAIADRLNDTDSVRVNLFFGSKDNTGAQNRVIEEKECHSQLGLNYDDQWITRYPAEIVSVLRRNVITEAQKRLTIEDASACPMISILKVDDIYLFFPYGTPDIRGSQSPWIAIKGESDKSELAKFLKHNISFYKKQV